MTRTDLTGYVSTIRRCGGLAQAVSFDGWESHTAQPLTECCEAAVTFTGSGILGLPDVLACKGCYEEVPAFYNEEGYDALLAQAIEQGCPDPEGCTSHTLYTLASLAQDEWRKLDEEREAEEG